MDGWHCYIFLIQEKTSSPKKTALETFSSISSKATVTEFNKAGSQEYHIF